jgi:hypothetical protein
VKGSSPQARPQSIRHPATCTLGSPLRHSRLLFQIILSTVIISDLVFVILKWWMFCHLKYDSIFPPVDALFIGRFVHSLWRHTERRSALSWLCSDGKLLTSTIKNWRSIGVLHYPPARFQISSPDVKSHVHVETGRLELFLHRRISLSSRCFVFFLSINSKELFWSSR